MPHIAIESVKTSKQAGKEVYKQFKQVQKVVESKG